MLFRSARSVRHLTEIAALLAERGVELVVFKQGIDTTTPAGRLLFPVIGEMDEMLADLISEATLEGLEAARARGRTGGRKPKLTTRQVSVAQQMYDEKDADGKRVTGELTEKWANMQVSEHHQLRLRACRVRAVTRKYDHLSAVTTGTPSRAGYSPLRPSISD